MSVWYVMVCQLYDPAPTKFIFDLPEHSTHLVHTLLLRSTRVRNHVGQLGLRKLVCKALLVCLLRSACAKVEVRAKQHEMLSISHFMRGAGVQGDAV